MAEFSNIQEKFIHYVDGIIANNRISHAYLVEVNNYDNDIPFIYDFIKMILCNIQYDEIKTSDNPIIHLIDDGNYPDISVISSDTSVINKALIKSLQKEFSNKSLLNGKKIYIIKEAEKLNGYSANTILKFLEEPEDDIIAFLVTDNRYHVLDTILSRCQILTLKDESVNFDIDDQIFDLLDCVLNPNNFFIKYNSYIKDTFVDKNVLKEQLLVVENVILSYLENSKNLSKEVKSLLDNKNNRELIRILSVIEDEIPKLDFNVNFKLWIDSLFAKLIGG